MRTPITPVPDAITRWASWARWLRWLDALVAWLVLWAFVAGSLTRGSTEAHAILAASLLGVLAWLRPLRVSWRPVSAAVGVAVSRELRPGDSAWYVGRRQVERVLVTGRRRLRMVIVRPDWGLAEGLTVRRTRVLLIPAEARRRRRSGDRST